MFGQAAQQAFGGTGFGTTLPTQASLKVAAPVVAESTEIESTGSVVTTAKKAKKEILAALKKISKREEYGHLYAHFPQLGALYDVEISLSVAEVFFRDNIEATDITGKFDPARNIVVMKLVDLILRLSRSDPTLESSSPTLVALRSMLLESKLGIQREEFEEWMKLVDILVDSVINGNHAAKDLLSSILSNISHNPLMTDTAVNFLLDRIQRIKTCNPFLLRCFNTSLQVEGPEVKKKRPGHWESGKASAALIFGPTLSLIGDKEMVSVAKVTSKPKPAAAAAVPVPAVPPALVIIEDTKIYRWKHWYIKLSGDSGFLYAWRADVPQFSSEFRALEAVRGSNGWARYRVGAEQKIVYGSRTSEPQLIDQLGSQQNWSDQSSLSLTGFTAVECPTLHDFGRVWAYLIRSWSGYGEAVYISISEDFACMTKGADCQMLYGDGSIRVLGADAARARGALITATTPPLPASAVAGAATVAWASFGGFAAAASGAAGTVGGVKSSSHIHPLAPVIGGRRLTARCDVCSQKGNCAFYCGPCDWDICQSCLSAEDGAAAGGHALSKGSFQCRGCRMAGPSMQSSDMYCAPCGMCAVCCSRPGSRCREPPKFGDKPVSSHNIQKGPRAAPAGLGAGGFGGFGAAPAGASCARCHQPQGSRNCSEHHCAACRWCAVCCAKEPVCGAVPAVAAAAAVAGIPFGVAAPATAIPAPAASAGTAAAAPVAEQKKTPYMVFYAAKKEEVKAANPGDHAGQLGMKIQQMWNALSEEQRKDYADPTVAKVAAAKTQESSAASSEAKDATGSQAAAAGAAAASAAKDSVAGSGEEKDEVEDEEPGVVSADGLEETLPAGRFQLVTSSAVAPGQMDDTVLAVVKHVGGDADDVYQSFGDSSDLPWVKLVLRSPTKLKSLRLRTDEPASYHNMKVSVLDDKDAEVWSGVFCTDPASQFAAERDLIAVFGAPASAATAAAAAATGNAFDAPAGAAAFGAAPATFAAFGAAPAAPATAPGFGGFRPTFAGSPFAGGGGGATAAVEAAVATMGSVPAVLGKTVKIEKIAAKDPSAVFSNFRFSSLTVNKERDATAAVAKAATSSGKAASVAVDEAKLAEAKASEIVAKLSVTPLPDELMVVLNQLCRIKGLVMDRRAGGYSHFSGASPTEKMVFLQAVKALLELNLAALDGLPPQSRGALDSRDMKLTVPKPKVTAGERKKPSKQSAAVDIEKKPGFDVARATGGFTFSMGNKKVSFPNGPISVFSDISVPSKEGTSTVNKLTWNIKVDGNASWGIGVVPESSLGQQGLLVDPLHKGATGFLSSSLSGGPPDLQRLAMQGKMLQITVDTKAKTLVLKLDGRDYSSPIHETYFPMRLCLLGYNSTTGQLFDSSPAPAATLPGVHWGLMTCACAHMAGSLPYPLDGSRHHLSSVCKWACCQAPWSQNSCSVPAPKQAPASGSNAAAQRKLDDDDEDEDEDGDDDDDDDDVVDSSGAGVTLAAARFAAASGLAEVHSLSGVVAESVFREVAVILTQHFYDVDGREPPAKRTEAGQAGQRRFGRAAGEDPEVQLVELSTQIVQLVLKSPFSRLIAPLFLAPFIHRCGITAKLMMNEVVSRDKVGLYTVGETSPSIAVQLLERLDKLKASFKDILDRVFGSLSEDDLSVQILMEDGGIGSGTESAIAGAGGAGGAAFGAKAAAVVQHSAPAPCNPQELIAYTMRTIGELIDGLVSKEIALNTVKYCGAVEALHRQSLKSALQQYTESRYRQGAPLPGSDIRRLFLVFQRVPGLFNKSFRRSLDALWVAASKEWVVTEALRVTEPTALASSHAPSTSGPDLFECAFDVDKVVASLLGMLSTLKSMLCLEFGMLNLKPDSVARAVRLAMSSQEGGVFQGISAAVAISLARLLDSRTSCSMSVPKVESSISKVIDLAKVFCGGSPSEFKAVYDVYLMVRLASGNSYSLSAERRAVTDLGDALSDGLGIINQVETQQQGLLRFRKWLLDRLDSKEIKLSDQAFQIAIDDSEENLQILTSPKFLSLQDVDTQLILPFQLRDIAAQFEAFAKVDVARLQVFEVNDVDMPTAAAAPALVGPKCASGHQMSAQAYQGGSYGGGGGGGGYSCNICGAYGSSSTERWICIACTYDVCFNCKPKTAASTAPAAASKPKPTLTLTQTKRTSNAQDGRSSNSSKGSELRQLKWCHSASSVVVKVATPKGKTVFVQMSVPQAAVLCYFNDTEREKVKVSDILKSTGLDFDAALPVLASLLEPAILVKREKSLRTVAAAGMAASPGSELSPIAGTPAKTPSSAAKASTEVAASSGVNSGAGAGASEAPVTIAECDYVRLQYGYFDSITQPTDEENPVSIMPMIPASYRASRAASSRDAKWQQVAAAELSKAGPGAAAGASDGASTAGSGTGVWSPKIVSYLCDMKAKGRVNMFSPASCIQLLINEFHRIRTLTQDFCKVEIENDDVHEWSLKFYNFDSSSGLGKDMQEMNMLLGYQHVEVRLHFPRGKYPCSPPLLAVTRPRLTQPLTHHLLALASLQQASWSPFNGLDMLLRDLHRELEAYARVNRNASSDGRGKELLRSDEYSDLEHLLVQLSLVTEVPPRVTAKPLEAAAAAAAADASELESESALVATAAASAAKPAPASAPSPAAAAAPAPATGGAGGAGGAAVAAGGSKGGPWAKGTGYGVDGLSDWNMDEYKKTQEMKDGMKQSLLLAALRAAQELLQKDNMRLAADVRDVLADSCLIPLLSSHICDYSLIDMEREKKSFRVVFELIDVIANVEGLSPMLLPLPGAVVGEGASKTLGEHAGDLHKKLTSYLQQKAKDKPSAGGAGDSAEDEDDEAMMLYIGSVVESVAAAVETQRRRQAAAGSSSLSGGGGGLSDSGASVVGLKGSDLPQDTEGRYKAEMVELQMGEVEELSGYHYKAQLATISTNSKRSKRLTKEIADLYDSLPLSLSSSVWLRTSAERIDTLQFMISGPEGTPYSNGLFLFDTLFDGLYPSKPPLVNLQTTGKGSVRFNPNLYNCGKVCLSLLGTWQGQQGESWLEGQSTFLQVLVSIQSLILVADPFFNEPGDERLMGTPEGDKRSRAYSAVIREGTIRWAMLDQLKHPKKGFEEIIYKHFSLKKAMILAEVEEWVQESKLHPQPGSKHAANLLELQKSLVEQLDKLKEVASDK